MANLGFLGTPFDFAASHQDAHELIRVLSLNEGQAHVDKSGEEFVERDLFRFDVRAIAVFQDAEEYATQLIKDCL